MNTEDNNHSSEEREIDELYNKLEKTAPPAHLDASIQSAARDAVESTSRPASPFSGKFIAPASMVAVIVLAVIIVPLLVEQEAEQPLKQIPLMMKKESMEPLIATPASIPTRSEPRFNAYSVLPEDEEMPRIKALSDADNAVSSVMAPAAEVMTNRSSKSALEPTAHSMPRSEMEEDRAARTAEQWMTEIQILIDLQQFEQARSELVALQEYYPEFEIDQEILDSLDEEE